MIRYQGSNNVSVSISGSTYNAQHHTEPWKMIRYQGFGKSGQHRHYMVPIRSNITVIKINMLGRECI
jgi:hypothetical protein